MSVLSGLGSKGSAFNTLELGEEAGRSLIIWFLDKPAVTALFTFALLGVRSVVRAAIA